MNWGALTGWDYLLLLVTGLSVALGLLRGVILTIFALGAWIIALLGTPLVGPIAVEMAGFEAHAWVILVVTFIVLFATVRLVGVLVGKAVAGVGMKGVDRVAGGMFGVVRALVIVALLVAAARLTGMDQGPAWEQARTRPVLEWIAATIDPYLPARPQRQIRLT